MPKLSLVPLSLLLLYSAARKDVLDPFEDAFPAIQRFQPQKKRDPTKPPQVVPSLYDIKQWLGNPDGEIKQGNKTVKYRFRPKVESFAPAISELTDLAELQLFTDLYLGERVLIQADNEGLLSRCFDCGRARFKNSAFVSDEYGHSDSIWRIIEVDGGIAFRADNGNYISSCDRCWDAGAYPDQVFVHKKSCKGSSQTAWQPRHISGNKWLFQSENGLFMTRCENCVATANQKNFVFLSSDRKIKQAIWKIYYFDGKKKKGAKKRRTNSKKAKTAQPAVKKVKAKQPPMTIDLVFPFKFSKKKAKK